MDQRVGDALETYQPFVATGTCIGCHPSWKEKQRIGQASMGVVNVNRGVTESAAESRGIALNIGELTNAVGKIRQGGVQVQNNAKALADLAGDLQKLVEQFRLPTGERRAMGANEQGYTVSSMRLPSGSDTTLS